MASIKGFIPFALLDEAWLSAHALRCVLCAMRSGPRAQYLPYFGCCMHCAPWPHVLHPTPLCFRSQARDILKWENMLLWVHHVVVMSTCAATLAAPAGAGLYIMGTFILELGSIFFNLRTMYPESEPLKWMYYVTMPISNLLALGLGGFMCFTKLPGIGLGFKSLFGLSVLGVTFGRHRHQMIDMGRWGGSKKQENKKN